MEVQLASVDLVAGGSRAAVPEAAGTRPREKVVYESLNIVRVVLSVAVVLYHLGATVALDKYFGYTAFESLFGLGGARVPFFFVLSGFLLTLVYGRDGSRPDKTGGYLWRRFLRVYPTYWVILLMVMSPALFMASVDDAIPSDPWVMLKTVLLIPQPREVAGPTGAPVIITAWTLHYEIVVYLLVAAWIWSRRLGLVIAVALVANAAWCSQQQCSFAREFLSGISFLYFLFGAAAGWAVKGLPALPHARALFWVAAVAYFLVAAMTVGHQQRSLADPSLHFGVLAALILLCLTRTEAARPPRAGSRWIKLLSDSSYATYLLHFPLISLCCKVLVHLGLMSGAVGASIALVVTLACCIGAGLVFHLLIEKRLLGLRT